VVLSSRQNKALPPGQGLNTDVESFALVCPALAYRIVMKTTNEKSNEHTHASGVEDDYNLLENYSHPLTINFGR
jgi:hypothetical protein